MTYEILWQKLNRLAKIIEILAQVTNGETVEPDDPIVDELRQLIKDIEDDYRQKL